MRGGRRMTWWILSWMHTAKAIIETRRTHPGCGDFPGQYPAARDRLERGVTILLWPITSNNNNKQCPLYFYWGNLASPLWPSSAQALASASCRIGNMFSAPVGFIIHFVIKTWLWGLNLWSDPTVLTTQEIGLVLGLGQRKQGLSRFRPPFITPSPSIVWSGLVTFLHPVRHCRIMSTSLPLISLIPWQTGKIAPFGAKKLCIHFIMHIKSHLMLGNRGRSWQKWRTQWA